MDYFFLALGLIVLIFSGEFLVRGAVNLAIFFKISKLVIAMTIVSFGTSAPELFISLKAALGGHPDIAIGNVVGSNIANITLILGLTAIFSVIKVNINSLKLDWPVMFAFSLLLYLFLLNSVLSSIEGVILLSLLFVFGFYLFYKSKKEGVAAIDTDEIETVQKPNILKSIFFIILGSVGLVLGADWMLESSVNIAQKWNISERVIGITIIAFGTSLPELVTSIVAIYRKQDDISVGNLIGSNIFNISAILGITSIISPIKVSQEIIQFDLLLMLLASFIIFPLMLHKKTLSTWKGAFLFLFYVSYIVFLYYKH